MSDTPPPSAPSPGEWPPLSLTERRVLGVLVEKAKTTPDAYPLSVNSLVTGCNQKSNRDPGMSLSESLVEETLEVLQKKGLVSKITGSRVDRWRHWLYETWHVEKVELAVLAELLLRGAQTEGELRGRAGRMEPIADLDALRPVLRGLAERRLVVYLTPEGRRGIVLTHGFHTPQELERLRTTHANATPLDDETPAPERASRQPQFESQLAEVQAALAALQNQIADLTAQVQTIKQQLGI